MSERYVALLRGINVGGKCLVSMETLRSIFSEHGYEDVSTYINSGNVLFTTSDNPATLENDIEELLAKSLPFAPLVLVRSKEQINAAVLRMPASWNAPVAQKHNVIFLKKAIDTPSLLSEFAIKSDIETLEYQPGVLYWSALSTSLTRSTMVRLSSSPHYQFMTVRNRNTVLKLSERLH